MMSESFTQQAQALDEPAYQALKRALELSKWSNGKRLTADQKAICMQTIISYENLHFSENERSGYMPQACKIRNTDTVQPELIPTVKKN